MSREEAWVIDEVKISLSWVGSSMNRSSSLGGWTQLSQEVHGRMGSAPSVESSSGVGSGARLQPLVLIFGFDPETESRLISLVSGWNFEIIAKNFRQGTGSSDDSKIQAFSILKSSFSRTLLLICSAELDDQGLLKFYSELEANLTAPPTLILTDDFKSGLKTQWSELKSVGILSSKSDDDALAVALSKQITGRLDTLLEEHELLCSFIDETRGLIEQIESLALGLEKNPENKDLLNSLFGIAHTIKGASAFFEPKTLHHFFHRFEEVLKSVQGNTLKISQPVISATLKVVDVARTLLKEFGSFKSEDHDLDELCKVFSKEVLLSSYSELVPRDLQEIRPDANLSAVIPVKENSIKIDIPLLDQFLRASGEMTVVRNMVNKSVLTLEKRYSSDKDVLHLGELLEELHKVNVMLQTKITEVRKVSLKNVFKTLPRLVRDITTKTKKACVLKLEGEDLRVDSSISEVLNASLSHLIRNSIDHGLESSDERVRVGKPERGVVTVRASLKNEQVIVEVRDDGKGIDAVAIRKKLVAKGIKSENEAAQLTDTEIHGYIFESGFSTAIQTTEISGRGVGMSAVKDSISSIGGRIRIETEKSVGTGFFLELPIPKSVHIKNCLFVLADGKEIGVAQDQIVRLINMDSEENKRMVCEVEGGMILRLSDELVIPLISLGSILFSSQGFDLRNEFSVLVVRTESGKDIGLIVDEIRDFEDVVIKDLVPILKKIPVYSGATFLSDGTVGLLLSVDGVAAVAQVHVGVGIKKKLEREDTAIQCSDTSTEWLLFELGVPGVYAFPRDMVFRLEEFEGQAIQKSGGFDVIPYRGQILPIIQLGKFLGWDGGVKDGLEGRVQVVVMTHGQKFVAFKIKQILDIASTMNPIDEPISEQLGVRGNLIMGGKTVTVLDPERLLAV